MVHWTCRRLRRAYARGRTSAASFRHEGFVVEGVSPHVVLRREGVGLALPRLQHHIILVPRRALERAECARAGHQRHLRLNPVKERAGTCHRPSEAFASFMVPGGSAEALRSNPF